MGLGFRITSYRSNQTLFKLLHLLHHRLELQKGFILKSLLSCCPGHPKLHNPFPQMWLRQRERQRERGTMTKRQIRFPQYCESIDPTSSVYVLLKVIQEQPPRHSKRGKKTGPRNVLCTREICSWMAMVWCRTTSSGARPLNTCITSRTKRPNLIILSTRIY